MKRFLDSFIQQTQNQYAIEPNPHLNSFISQVDFKNLNDLVKNLAEQVKSLCVKVKSLEKEIENMNKREPVDLGDLSIEEAEVLFFDCSKLYLVLIF